MNKGLRNMIYDNLDQKPTEELTEIWLEHDTAAWSGVTFEVIAEILLERLGRLPSAAELAAKTDGDGDADGADFPDQGELDRRQPVFYQPDDVASLANWLDRAAIAAVILSVLSGMVGFSSIYRSVAAMTGPDRPFLAWLIALLTVGLAVAFQCIIAYFALRALGSILSILMEMEFTSRRIRRQPVLTPPATLVGSNQS